MTKNQPTVLILMGSQSDLPIMKDAASVLEKLGIGFDLKVLSAHRTPKELVEYIESSEKKGAQVVIAGAGGAAHLPGVIAAHTLLPVIGVPIGNGPLHGQDSLLSIVQMPKGIPVACTSINGAWNAGLLAAQMLAVSSLKMDEQIMGRLQDYRAEMREKILSQEPKF